MKRAWISLLLSALMPVAGATTYTLPGNLPSGCSSSGASYTCPALSLGYGDVIVVNAPKPATLTINGNLSTDTSQINQAGSASDLTLIVNGTLTLGYQARIKANVTATSVNDAGGGNVLITGNLAANGGNVSLAYKSSVTGNLSTSGTGTISTGQAGSIGGSVTGGSGAISIAETSTVAGSVSGSGNITVVQSAVVSGNVTSTSGAVSLGYQAKVNGNVSTSGSIDLAQGSRVGGTVDGGTGDVTVGYAATVVGALTTSSGRISFAQNAVASACVKSTGSASITLGYQSSVNSVCCGSASCSRSCVTNNSTYALPAACQGAAPSVASFGFTGTGSASTCAPQTLTITARDASGNTLTSYTGTVTLSTSSGRGDWSAGSSPAPSGSLVTGAPGSGAASYTFAAGDAGVVKLRLSHSLAQNVTVTAVDASVTASSSTSAAIAYANNAFVWAEDLNSRIAGTNVVVAGRSHDLQISLVKRDPTTGSCGIATDFSGTRTLKLWRTDSGGSWTAPTASAGAASTSVPPARPGSNNLSLNFSAGVANLNLLTTDIGKYTLQADDDSLSYASSTVSGSLGPLTVRPYTLTVSGITRSGTANPGGSAASDSVFAPAGASFSATVAAYLWSAASDTNNNGSPANGTSLASVTAGGLAPSFNTAVNLSPLAGSQTPTGGVLGTLANGSVTGFSGGRATATTLQYSEVGSFQFNNSAVVTAYLGTAGLSLDAITFAADGTPNARVGRFVPAGFTVSSPSVSHRVDQSCAVSSSFTYLDENFRLGFTLTAVNAAGATTQNYTGSFARLDLATAANLRLAGIAGSTMFKTGNGRLSLSSSSGSWASGVASGVTLTASALRGAAADGPFDTAAFGIAPVDSDGVTVATPDLDTDSPANGADAAQVGTIPLRLGRLRLQNAMAAANRPARLPLVAQYWTGSAYNTNTLDSCTRIAATHLSFGNLRKTLVASDAVLSNGPVTLAAGVGNLTLAAPASGHTGTLDVAVSLGSSAADTSCLGWTPAKAATAGAGLAALRGLWCGSSLRDPSARVTWGLYRGDNGVLYQRENY